MTEQNQDHLIMAQKEALEKEIADSIALVGAKEGISVLEEELKHDENFLRKAK
jgi:hypothetical protein